MLEEGYTQLLLLYGITDPGVDGSVQGTNLIFWLCYFHRQVRQCHYDRSCSQQGAADICFQRPGKQRPFRRARPTYGHFQTAIDRSTRRRVHATSNPLGLERGPEEDRDDFCRRVISPSQGDGGAGALSERGKDHLLLRHRLDHRRWRRRRCRSFLGRISLVSSRRLDLDRSHCHVGSPRGSLTLRSCWHRRGPHP